MTRDEVHHASLSQVGGPACRIFKYQLGDSKEGSTDTETSFGENGKRRMGCADKQEGMHLCKC